MNLEFCSLGSGSKGNATLLRAGGVTVLIDAGFSCRELDRRLDVVGIQPDALDALFISHEHSDHVRGAEVFSRRHKVPVYMSEKSSAVVGLPDKDLHDLIPLKAQEPVSVGPLEVFPFHVPHDAKETFAFRVTVNNNLSAVVISDLGSVTDEVVNHCKDADIYFMEFNHDSDMLMEGSYPWNVKYRIRGDFGHLENNQAAELARRSLGDHTRCLVLTHLSEENNLPGLAQGKALDVIHDMEVLRKNPPRLMIASQFQPLPLMRCDA